LAGADDQAAGQRVRADAERCIGESVGRKNRGHQADFIARQPLAPPPSLSAVWLSAADERNDFKAIAVGQSMLGVARAGNNLLVDFDGDTAEWKLQPFQKISDSRWRAQLASLAVHKHANALVHAQLLLTQVTVSSLPRAEGPHRGGLGSTNGRGGFDPGE